MIFCNQSGISTPEELGNPLGTSEYLHPYELAEPFQQTQRPGCPILSSILLEEIYNAYARTIH